MKLKSLACRVWLLAILGVGSLAVGTVRAEPVPSLKSKDLAQGPYSSMHMLLEKTFLKVDVLTVDVRFGKSAHARLAELARGKSYSEALGRQAAKIAISADDALVQLHFVRDVALDQWMDAVRENLEQARVAGLISAKTEKRMGQGLPSWFAPIAERGYQKGDRLLYRLRPGSLRTVVVTAQGKVLVERRDRDKDALRVVMASYFAPGSDFRKPLLRSLFKPSH
jgi:hypothetical protein